MKDLHYTLSILRFAFRANRGWYGYIIASVVSITFELGAILALMPLAALASGSVPSPTSLSSRILATIGVPLTAGGLLSLFLALFTARITSLFLSQLWSAWLSRQLLAKLATSAFDNLINHLPMQQIEAQSIGSYIALVGDESFRASLIVNNLATSFAQFSLVALYYAAIVYYSPAAGLGILTFLAIALFALTGSFRYAHRLGAKQAQLSRDISSTFLDALNGLRSVRAYLAEPFVSAEYRTRLYSYTDTQVRLDAVSQAAKLGPAIFLLVLLLVLVSIPGLSSKFLNDFSFVMTIILMMMRLFPVIGQMLITVMRVVADIRVGRDVIHLAEAQPTTVTTRRRPFDENIDSLGLRNLSFAYSDTPVLTNVNLQFVRGKSYAIVGPSGIGKSTIFDLILKFYKPRSGDILINGRSIGEIETASLRRRVLLVSQDVTIFNDTIARNIAFGAECKPDLIDAAAKTACLDDFVATLDDGLNAVLAYRGANLSGGQKQRIGIARALARDPDVLLLDECTSALDPDIRQRVVDLLIARFQDRIIVFITHDAWLAGRVDEVIDFGALSGS